MMKKVQISKIIVISMAICLLLNIPAFADDNHSGMNLGMSDREKSLTTSEMNTNSEEEAESLSFHFTQKTLEWGKKIDLNVFDASGKKLVNKNLSWSSSKPDIVSVSDSGVISTKKNGTAVITASDGKLKAKCKIIVRSSLKRIYLNITAKKLKIGGKVQLKAGFIPSNNKLAKKVMWKSSNTSVATVSKNGLVRAKKAGVAFITAKTGKKKAVCTITVNPRFKQLDYSFKTVEIASSSETRKIVSVHPALKYTYEVVPLLPPFGEYVFVKTGNPDPFSFRFVDKSVKTGEDCSASYLPCPDTFPDVKYENQKTLRVNGGYIFQADDWTVEPDGGTLTLQIVNPGRESQVWTPMTSAIGFRSGVETRIYSDTTVKVKCPKVKSYIQYIIDKYTDPSKDLFANLDNVQEVLNKIAVYPTGAYNTEQRDKKMPFPALATSPYEEKSLTRNYSIYESAGSLLVCRLYPFLLDSASFPYTMEKVAKSLQPKCKVSHTNLHNLIFVSYKNRSKNYGGQGIGSSGGLLPVKSVKKTYTFRGDPDDFVSNGNINNMKDTLLRFHEEGQKAAAAFYKKYDLSSEALGSRIKTGSWIQVSRQGLFGSDKDLAYITHYIHDKTSAYPLSGAWVDGRYIDNHEAWEVGAKFKDHPTSAIVVRNVTYTDKYGDKYTEDLVYIYDRTLKRWSAADYYCYFDENESLQVPDMFFLSKKQVEKMGVDKNTNSIPTEVLLYDGSKKPGTKQKTVPVKKVTLNKKNITLDQRDFYTLKAKIAPANATYKDIVWSSSNSKVVYVDDTGTIQGLKKGNAVITVKTLEGRKIATCNVTVRKTGKKELTDQCIVFDSNPLYYNSKIIRPSFTVTYKGKKLVKGKDYKVIYYSGNEFGKGTLPGAHGMTVCGIGEYYGWIYKEYYVQLKLPSPKVEIVKNKNGTLKIKWEKYSESCSGYNIQYDVYDQNTGKLIRQKELWVTDRNATSDIISGLQKKRFVMIKITPYKKIAGTIYNADFFATYLRCTVEGETGDGSLSPSLSPTSGEHCLRFFGSCTKIVSVYKIIKESGGETDPNPLFPFHSSLQEYHKGSRAALCFSTGGHEADESA